MSNPYRCEKCEHLLLEADDRLRGLVKIKVPGTAVFTIDIKSVCIQNRGNFIPVRNGKKYLFCIVNVEENILKIMCPICKNFFLINLDAKTCESIGKDDWPAV